MYFLNKNNEAIFETKICAIIIRRASYSILYNKICKSILFFYKDSVLFLKSEQIIALLKK